MSNYAGRMTILGGILLLMAGCASSPKTAQVPRTQPPPAMPAAPAEVRSAQPGADYVWIPGHYEWRAADRNYVWVPGSWIVPPRDQTWVPGHWETRSTGRVWVKSHWQATASPPLAQAAPPMPAPPAEVRTAQPGSDYVWIPGRYEWRASDRKYVWVPGTWIVPPPGYVFVPGRWETRSDGTVWVHGRWQRA
jgi:hypothetical protein